MQFIHFLNRISTEIQSYLRNIKNKSTQGSLMRFIFKNHLANKKHIYTNNQRKILKSLQLSGFLAFHSNISGTTKITVLADMCLHACLYF